MVDTATGATVKPQQTPLPKGQMITVFMVQLCEGINVNVLFPFVAFMVEEFGYTGKELGYHVGGLAATFCLGQLLSSIPWGMLSDRVGRKPPVVLGVLGTGIGMVVLGMSTTYPQAIAGRAISGLLTGNVGILKSFLTEITDDTNRGHGFSLMSLGWSLGTIIGPLAGGMLAYPSVKYPSLFASDGIFAEHPFLLPCLLCVACNVTAGIFTMIFMEESRWKKHGREDSDNEDSDKGCAHRLGLIASNICACLGDGDEADYEALDVSEHSRASSLDEEHHSVEEADSHSDSCGGDADDVKNGHSSGDIEMSICREKATSTTADLTNIKNGSNYIQTNNFKEEEAQRKNQPLITRNVVLAVSSYGLCAMGYIIVDETIPLMLKLDRSQGGLSFDSSEIGSLLALGGLTMLIWTLTLLPKISHLSKLWLLKTFNIVCMPVVLLYPFLATCSPYILNYAGEEGGRKIIFILYVVVMTAKNCLATIIFLSVMIFVNHSVEDHQLGAVNGIGQTVAAGARAVGPAAGGILWSLSEHIHFIYTNYIFSVVVFLVLQLIVYQLPPSIDGAKSKPRPEYTGSGPLEEYEAVASMLLASSEDEGCCGSNMPPAVEERA